MSNRIQSRLNLLPGKPSSICDYAEQTTHINLTAKKSVFMSQNSGIRFVRLEIV